MQSLYDCRKYESKLEVVETLIGIYSQNDATFGYNTSASQCEYRVGFNADSAKKCSVGQLIPDSCYCPVMEGMDADNMLRTFSHVNELFQFNEAGVLLQQIQKTHDFYASREYAGYSVRDFVAFLEGLRCAFIVEANGEGSSYSPGYLPDAV